MTITISKKNYFFLFLLVVASLLPYFFLSLYAQPAGDDFVYAYNGKHFSLLENALRDYFHWTGRYTSNFLFVLNPMAFDSLTGYKLFADLLIVFTFIAFYFLIKTITNNSLLKVYLILCSGIISLLFLQQMPSLAQGIYWYTGSVIYQGANILALFYLSLLIHLLNKNYFINKILHTLLCLILLFLISGCNETIMIFLLLFHAILFAKNKNRLALMLLIFSCLSSLLVIFSPGNAVREAAFPDRHQLFHSLLFSAVQSFRFFFLWIANIPLLIASLLYIPLSIRISEKSSLFKNSFHLKPVLSTCFLFLLVFLSAFPAYWSTGILGQHRTVNVAYLFFIILWFINLTVWINFLSARKLITTLSTFATTNFLILIISIIPFSFITGNGYFAMHDLLSGKAKNFDKEMSARYELLSISRKRSSEICILDTLKNKPTSLFVLDISDNENDWMNKGMAAYFGVAKVAVGTKQSVAGSKQ
ncbi:MAG: DUF6056 family protein [Bacteroidota bacterium]